MARRDGERDAGAGWSWLRQLRRKPERPKPPPPVFRPPSDSPRGRLVCVASGKGGTGKSLVAANLAVYYARKGHRVVLFDADLGLANAHLMLGIYPRRNLSHVLLGLQDLESVFASGPYGLQLLSGGTGIAELAALGDTQIYQIAAQVELLEERYDYVIIDAAAGISPSTMVFLYAAPETIVVTTPDLTAMTDAYALLKTLRRHHPDSRTWLVANRVPSPERGREVYRRIQAVAEKYLHHRPHYLGSLPEDPAVSTSIAHRRALLMSHPRSPATRALLEIGRQLHAAARPPACAGRPTERILPLYQDATS